MHELIQEGFGQSIQQLISCADSLAKPLEQAAKTLTNSLLANNKIICLSYTRLNLGQYMADLMLNGLTTERPSLPAIYLPPSSHQQNGTDKTDKIEQQLASLSAAGDTVLLYRDSSLQPNITPLIAFAANNKITLLDICADNAGNCSPSQSYIRLAIDASNDQVIEGMLALSHQLCHLVESELFGSLSSQSRQSL